MNCPKCGTPNPEFAIYCFQCGTQLSEGAAPEVVQTVQPAVSTPPDLPRGNGVLVLVFGIIGIATCLPISIIAWLMGHSELSKMRMGLISDEDETIIKVGRVLGIIGTALMVIIGFLIFFFVMLSLQLGSDYINDLRL